MESLRIVTEAEALADARQRQQRDVDAWPERKARRARFVQWCKAKRPTLTQAYCDGSTMVMEQFLLHDEDEHG